MARPIHRSTDTGAARRALIGAAITLLAIAAIAVATLTSLGDADTSDESMLWCVMCDRERVVDFAANVLLFAPFGFGLVLAGTTWLRATLAGLALTLGIELVQAFVLTGRYASAGDVLANTAGALLGALAARWLLRRRLPAAS